MKNKPAINEPVSHRGARLHIFHRGGRLQVSLKDPVHQRRSRDIRLHRTIQAPNRTLSCSGITKGIGLLGSSLKKPCTVPVRACAVLSRADGIGGICFRNHSNFLPPFNMPQSTAILPTSGNLKV